MNRTLLARIPGWEIWVGRCQYHQWDAFVRPIAGRMFPDGGEDELVPGGPFPTPPEATQAGMAYARTKPRPDRQVVRHPRHLTGRRGALA